MQNFQIIEGQKYELIGKLGNGSQGQVLKGRNIETNQYVAIKQQSNISENELNVIKSIRQQKKKYLIEIYGFQQNQNGIQIAMELAKGDFFQYMQTLEFKCLKNEQKYKFFIQMLYAVKEFHELGFIHRDLKPENFILLDNKQVKLIDFGVSKQKPQLMVNQTQNIGTSFYMAPEVISSTHYNESADIWGLGCIWFEILTGQTFFNGNCNNEIQYQIVQLTQIEITTKINNDKILKPMEKQILLKVLQKQANFRLKIEEFIKQVEDLINSQSLSVAFFPQQLNQNFNQIPQNFQPIIQKEQNPPKQFQLIFSASKNFQQIQIPYSQQKIEIQEQYQVQSIVNEKFDKQQFLQRQNNSQNNLQNQNQPQKTNSEVKEFSVKEKDLNNRNEKQEKANDEKELQIENEQKNVEEEQKIEEEKQKLGEEKQKLREEKQNIEEEKQKIEEDKKKLAQVKQNKEEEQLKIEQEKQKTKILQEEKFNMMMNEAKQKLKGEFEMLLLKQKEEHELKQQQLAFKDNQERKECLELFKNSFNNIFTQIKRIEMLQSDLPMHQINIVQFQNQNKMFLQSIQTLQTRSLQDYMQNLPILDFQKNLIKVSVEVQEKLAHELQNQNQKFKQICTDEKSQNDQIKSMLKDDQLQLQREQVQMHQQLLSLGQEIQQYPKLTNQLNNAKNLIQQNQNYSQLSISQNNIQNQEVPKLIQEALKFHQNYSEAQKTIYQIHSQGQFFVLSEQQNSLYQFSQSNYLKLKSRFSSSQFNQNEIKLQQNIYIIEKIFQNYYHQLQNAKTINCFRNTFQLYMEISQNIQFYWEQIEEKGCQSLILKKRQKFNEKLGKKMQYLENQLQRVNELDSKKKIEEEISSIKYFQKRLNDLDSNDQQTINCLKVEYQETNQTKKRELQQYFEKIQQITKLLSQYQFHGNFNLQRRLINNNNIDVIKKKFQQYLSFLLEVKKKNENLLTNYTGNKLNSENKNQKFQVEFQIQFIKLTTKIDQQNVEINKYMGLLKKICNSSSNTIEEEINVKTMFETWEQFNTISQEIKQLEQKKLTLVNGLQSTKGRLNQLEKYQYYLEKVDQALIIQFNKYLDMNQKYYLQLLQEEQKILLFILTQLQKQQKSTEKMNAVDAKNQQNLSEYISTLNEDEIQILYFEDFIKKQIIQIKRLAEENYLIKMEILKKQFQNQQDIQDHLKKIFEGILINNYQSLLND